MSEWPSPGLVYECVRSGVSLWRGGAVTLRVRLALQLRTLTNYITRCLLETGGFRPQLHPQL